MNLLKFLSSKNEQKRSKETYGEIEKREEAIELGKIAFEKAKSNSALTETEKLIFLALEAIFRQNEKIFSYMRMV